MKLEFEASRWVGGAEFLRYVQSLQRFFNCRNVFREISDCQSLEVLVRIDRCISCATAQRLYRIGQALWGAMLDLKKFDRKPLRLRRRGLFVLLLFVLLSAG